MLTSQDMDAIITYVNGNDPLWRAEYEAAAKIPLLDKRFRDWGTLKYLLRGIETCMPFVQNVYLIVSGQSQIPDWADTSSLIPVLHKDIIPEGFLPTFNSCSIEMFMHRIPGLDERFLYFNDDMYPLAPCREEDFFPAGRPAIGFEKCFFASAMYKRQSMNADHLARKALGMKPGRFFYRPQHICSPMLLSLSKEAFAKEEDEISRRVTRTRDMKNVNQYFYLDYALYKGDGLRRKLSCKHFSMAIASPSKIASYIVSPKRSLACINDVEMSDVKYEAARKAILEAFQSRFPKKSRFEK